MRYTITKTIACATIAIVILVVSNLAAYPGAKREQLLTRPQNHPYMITEASVNYIVINDLGFTPISISIEVGESVTWHNATETTHVLVQGIPSADATLFLPLVTHRSEATMRVNQIHSSEQRPLVTDEVTIPPGTDITLTFNEIGTFDYYLETSSQFTSKVFVGERQVTMIQRTSPADGEGQVSVSRETILEFSHPLNPTTVTADAIYVEFGGQRPTATLHLSPDHKRVTLFYDQPLPASARVRLTVDGDQLRDDRAAAVDADGDGQPGGTALIDFDTLGITIIPGTSVCGTVYASELGDDGQGGTVDVPLEGTTITVDGQEDTLFTTTNADGNFCLDPAPSGRFFVHIDGRTATNTVPNDAYYPYVGKAWESIPGQQTGVGVAHLPLVVEGTLQDVSPTTDTTIYLPDAVVNDYPDFADVAIMVPADSLFADDGTRGGQVGIAPVPSDRLPGTLPDTLNFPIVITVQTDSATNFDTPAPVCFPNLPDPTTGSFKHPGDKSALMSFNHDSGRWEIIGPMTVSDDRTLVCTDPGIGILAPGWHGVFDRTSGSGGPPLDTPDTCEDADSTLALRLPDVKIPGGMQLGAGACISGLGSCWDKVLTKVQSCFREKVDCDATLNHGNDGTHSTGSLHYSNRAVDFSGVNRCAPYWPRFTEQQLKDIGTCITGSSLTYKPLNDWWSGTFTSDSCSFTLLIEDPDGNNSHIHIEQDTTTVRSQSNFHQAIQLNEDVVNAPQPPFHILITLDNETAHQRFSGVTNFDSFLPSNSVGRVFIYDPATKLVWSSPFYTQDAGTSTTITPQEQGEWYAQFGESNYVIDQETGEWNNTPQGGVVSDWIADPIDEDGDGLGTMAESILGTNPAIFDTDSDGISDGAEVEQGTNPLDGLPVQTGIIGSADTPGTAVDVCAVNNIAIVADGAAGISVFDVANNFGPVAIAQVDTPGHATRVTCTADRVAIADGRSGLAVVDISDPPAATITQQIPLGDVKAVAAAAGLAYAGTADGAVIATTLQDGVVVNEVNVGEPILDLQLGGQYLYVYAKGNLYTLDLAHGLAIVDIETMTGTYASDEIRPLRLFVGHDIAYAVHRQGYNTLDLTDPADPALIATGDTTQFGWRQIVDNGSGLGLATVGPNSTDDGPHNVSLYDVSDGAQTDQFRTEFETPGIASAVSIYNGLGYVADGEAGFQVVNYLAFDAQGVPPTITLDTNTSGEVAEEGQTLIVAAQVSDDVQVRNVEFYINGELASTDGNYPFAYRNLTPLASLQPTMTLQAKAADTGGNIVWSDLITLTIMADATPPQVGVTVPAANASLYNTEQPVTAVLATFNEPLDPTTVTTATVQLIAAGADGTFGTADDTAIVDGTLAYEATINTMLLTFGQPLAVDRYQLRLADTLTDQAGNPLAPFEMQFEVTSGAFGNWNLSRTIEFNSPQAAHYNPIDGLIYVGRRDTASDGLYRIETDGHATKVADGSYVAAVAVDPATGNIFFSEDFRGIIYRHELTGTGRTTWVSGFHDNDDDPIGIAFAPLDYSGSLVAPGDGLVVDRGSNGPDEVWRFSPESAQGETAVHSDDGTLVDSTDVAVSATDIYLVDDKDAGDGVIYTINGDGTLAVITSTMTLPAPEGIAVDPLTGDLLIQDLSIDQIVTMNPQTGITSDALPGFDFDFPTASSFAGVDISPDGQWLIVTDDGPGRIYVFARAGR